MQHVRQIQCLFTKLRVLIKVFFKKKKKKLVADFFLTLSRALNVSISINLRNSTNSFNYRKQSSKDSEL